MSPASSSATAAICVRMKRPIAPGANCGMSQEATSTEPSIRDRRKGTLRLSLSSFATSSVAPVSWHRSRAFGSSGRLVDLLLLPGIVFEPEGSDAAAPSFHFFIEPDIRLQHPEGERPPLVVRQSTPLHEVGNGPGHTPNIAPGEGLLRVASEFTDHVQIGAYLVFRFGVAPADDRGTRGRAKPDGSVFSQGFFQIVSQDLVQVPRLVRHVQCPSEGAAERMVQQGRPVFGLPVVPS